MTARPSLVAEGVNRPLTPRWLRCGCAKQCPLNLASLKDQARPRVPCLDHLFSSGPDQPRLPLCSACGLVGSPCRWRAPVRNRASSPRRCAVQPGPSCISGRRLQAFCAPHRPSPIHTGGGSLRGSCRAIHIDRRGHLEAILFPRSARPSQPDRSPIVGAGTRRSSIGFELFESRHPGDVSKVNCGHAGLPLSAPNRFSAVSFGSRVIGAAARCLLRQCPARRPVSTAADRQHPPTSLNLSARWAGVNRSESNRHGEGDPEGRAERANRLVSPAATGATVSQASPATAALVRCRAHQRDPEAA